MHNPINQDTPWFKRIKIYRCAAELTQQEVADQVGVEHRRYWGWEAGQNVPREDHQIALAAALGVEHDAIFGGKNQDFEGLKRKQEETK